MKRIFDVRLWVYDPSEDRIFEKGTRYTDIILPAFPYELLDALEKLRLDAGASPHWDIRKYYAFNYVFNRAITEKQGSIYELNALAWKLSELDGEQSISFEGLMRISGKTGMPLSDLIDLAYSTGCCQVTGGIRNDYQLGQFCAENNLIPGIDPLPAGAAALLDFTLIGQEHRQRDGGVLVMNTATGHSGYVKRLGALAKVYQTLELIPSEPDYAFLLHIARGYYAPPASDCEKSVRLELPASREALDAVLSALKVDDWNVTSWYGLDCRVPLLTDTIYDIGVNDAFNADWMNWLNALARPLADMDPKTLAAYKALLSAVRCEDIQTAAQLMAALDDYVLSPEYRSSVNVAKGRLSAILRYPDRALIEPCLDLNQYGKALIQDCGGVLTDYGFLRRKDGQPVQDRNSGQDKRT